MFRPTPPSLLALVTVAMGLTVACGGGERPEPADLLILNGNIYTLSWGEPAADSTPAADAPRSETGWTGDAEAVAVRGGLIVFVGSSEEAEAYRGEFTRVIDAGRATVLPGLIDSHTHVVRLGANLNRVNLVGVATEAEAVERVVEWAADLPNGDWIVGYGWDEGAWADNYPTMDLLTERVPNHPALLQGLHSFASWGNRLAFEQAGIDASTPNPPNGEIRKDPNGQPTGVLIDRATSLLNDAVPPPTAARVQANVLAGLQEMAANGYVAVHEAGASAENMQAFETLEAEERLPLRVYAMISGREPELLDAWLEKGPDADTANMLVTRSVKGFMDGALGSRGARLIDDYSDQTGHRGNPEQQFDTEKVAALMRGGFQVAIHAIGDSGNREALDYIASATDVAAGSDARHRIEHAQVLHPNDIGRFAELGVIASMEPSHAVEDMVWAEDRVGPERILGAYAWRSLREAGARLTFNSDLPGTGYDIAYGLHSAITRQNPEHAPKGGWYPEQALTAEEALRAFTTWAAYAAFQENETGVLAPGRWGDITIMDLDPLAIGDTEPARLFDRRILYTIVAGNIVYEGR